MESPIKAILIFFLGALGRIEEFSNLEVFVEESGSGRGFESVVHGLGEEGFEEEAPVSEGIEETFGTKGVEEVVGLTGLELVVTESIVGLVFSNEFFTSFVSLDKDN